MGNAAWDQRMCRDQTGITLIVAKDRGLVSRTVKSTASREEPLVADHFRKDGRIGQFSTQSRFTWYMRIFPKFSVVNVSTILVRFRRKSFTSSLGK
jgi:hypothetical protein